jgi:hypothetical protein
LKICFADLKSPTERHPKRNKHNRGKKGFFRVDFYVKQFMIFWLMPLHSVFELPLPRNTNKRDKTKTEEKAACNILSMFWFWQKVFNMFFCFFFYMCFWCSRTSLAEKRLKTQEK